MSASHTGAFWSYAHEDDRLDAGRIRSLAERLTAEYSLATGEELEIFVDRTGILWGQAWRERIDQALSSTTFFIPVLTPRYFTREECRAELLAFHRLAQELGTDEVFLPILYVPIESFDAENPDELIALASRYQYVDWTDYRLADEESPVIRRAVADLARRIRLLSSSIGQALLSKEIADIESIPDHDAAGLFDELERIQQLLPDWIESVESSETNDVQGTALSELLIPRIEALEKRPGQGQAHFATLQRFAKELLPLAQRNLDAASIYMRRSMELDPHIARVLQAAATVEQEIAIEALSELYDSIAKARVAIDESRRRQEQRERGELAIVRDWLQPRTGLSRLVRQVTMALDTAAKMSAEGNAIVEQWLEDLDLYVHRRADAE